MMNNNNHQSKILPVSYRDADYIPEIQQRLHDLLHAVLNKHAKVLMVRFDVRYPVGYNAPEDNSLFQGFIEYYRLYLYRHGYDPVYVWSRERNESSHFHYHVVFLLDGTRIRYMPTVDKADEIWCSKLGISKQRGFIHYCNPNGTAINRGDNVCLAECQAYLSYLAKRYSKEVISGARMWGASQAPR